MMDNIERIMVVSEDSKLEFARMLQHHVDALQAKGFSLEIQYSYNNDLYTALILGRRRHG